MSEIPQLRHRRPPPNPAPPQPLLPTRLESLLPIENVSWDEAFEYCQAIGGRLPTENEWEYAARGGIADARYGDLDAVAWHRTNSAGTTHPVGLKQANSWGLFDMLGNVWEWTDSDYYDDAKVARGGSWTDLARFARASARYSFVPSYRLHSIGFRCVWELR